MYNVYMLYLQYNVKMQGLAWYNIKAGKSCIPYQLIIIIVLKFDDGERKDT